MKEVLSTVTSKGQVTIPVEVRRFLGLKEGDKVAFALGDGEVRLHRTGSVVAATAGILRHRPPSRSAEELRQAAEEAIAEDAINRAGA